MIRAAVRRQTFQRREFPGSIRVAPPFFQPSPPRPDSTWIPRFLNSSSEQIPVTRDSGCKLGCCCLSGSSWPLNFGGCWRLPHGRAMLLVYFADRLGSVGMFSTRELLYFPRGINFQDLLLVQKLLATVEVTHPPNKPGASPSQPSSQESGGIVTPELARTQGEQRQHQISPIEYLRDYDDDDREVRDEEHEAHLVDHSVMTAFPSDEDITSAFASFSIGLDGEISDEGIDDDAPTPASRRSAATAVRVNSRHPHMPSYGTLALQKRPTSMRRALSSSSRRVAPAAATSRGSDDAGCADDESSVGAAVDRAGSGCRDKMVHSAVQKWLREQHRRLRASILVFSPATRKRVVYTVALDICSRLERGDQHQPLILRTGREQDKQQAGRGVLVVTSSKAAVEEWSELFRGNAYVRLLTYTDALAKRRQMGTHRLRCHDVIVTTFDVLKAHEIGLTEDGAIGGGEETAPPPADESGEWVVRHRGGPIVESSFLHMFCFADVVVDHNELSTVRATNQRGVSVRRIVGARKCSLVKATDSEGDVYHQALVRHARDIMNLRGDLVAASIILPVPF